ncbi:hypothetical protein WPS_04770 [Vulcanimicrobium alpinum]|uniref:ABM domain-containing protein n=1 Tax=Vulcanimicrobium alpinum TaxID=3016050 RepID=A0AAN2C8Q0_UNVUL|nr:antibiotic biosynthesis monooxygenase [Vulcanimicrobium alpinum]BDE05201.1 hypothetical protein WPS_04770 [Vulcanimicrobium alpinum]
MVGSIREYRLQPGKLNEVVRLTRDHFVPIVSNAPGFVSYSFTYVGGDEIVTTSIFETQAQAEQSNVIAAEWAKANLKDAVTAPPRVTTGRIPVRHVNEGTQPGYGVMRRFEIKREHIDQATKRVADGLVPLLSGMRGFCSYGLLVASTEDRGVTLSAFTDRAAAEESNQRALAWTRENLGDVLTKPIEVVTGEVKFRLAKAPVGAL